MNYKFTLITAGVSTGMDAVLKTDTWRQHFPILDRNTVEQISCENDTYFFLM